MRRKKTGLLVVDAQDEAIEFCNILRRPTGEMMLTDPLKMALLYNAFLKYFYERSGEHVDTNVLKAAIALLQEWLDSLEPGEEVHLNEALAVSKLNLTGSRSAVTAVCIFLYGMGYTTPQESWVKRANSI